MTREELIDKVRNAYDEWDFSGARGHDVNTRDLASHVLDTIFTALKEPTHEMAKAWAYAPTPPSSRTDWSSMLNASPLAPEEEK